MPPRIKAAPKIRQIYWCDFWRDAWCPEFSKTRPALVVSYKNRLYGPCLVVPITTAPQPDNEWALAIPPGLLGVECWAVCNHPGTVSPSRFAPFNGGIPLLPEREFNQVLDLMQRWLPRRFVIE